MNSFIKGMGQFDLQPSLKRRKRTLKRVILNDKSQDFFPEEPGIPWQGVSRAFRTTGIYLRRALSESNAKELPLTQKVRIITKEKNIADLFDGVSVRVESNGKTYVITNDKNKAISLKGVSLKVMRNGKICVVGEEKLS